MHRNAGKPHIPYHFVGAHGLEMRLKLLLRADFRDVFRVCLASVLSEFLRLLLLLRVLLLVRVLVLCALLPQFLPADEFLAHLRQLHSKA